MRAGSPRLLREINDRAAIEALLQRGAMTRSEVEAIIGLSKPATAQLLTRLEQDGAVVRDGLRGGSRGPRAQLWAVNGALAHVVAVDLTPSHADIVVADITGAILAEQQQELPDGGPGVVTAFADAVRATVGSAGLSTNQLCSVVVGSPGAVNPADGHLGFAPHLPGWEGFDMPGRLRELLEAPVTVENDVNLVALEEMVAGRATDIDDFVLIWLSEGIGAAVVINRRMLRGATGGAGEIDWMRVPDLAAADTGIDRRGIRLGDLLGSPTILKLARAHGLSARTAWSAVRKARTSGEDGQPFLTDLAKRIATGVAGVVSVVDPQLVLLAGETGQAGGEALCGLVATELHELVVPRTPVAPTLVTGNPVRAGALHSALALARQKVFGLTAAATAEPFRGSPRPA
ncbi:ROK family protein [Allokutzneria sp. NRRL B-24872]|uniref:ROK family transcriptional regulator n=1 Tax=Allokutzneria sp. NRRL B-24872 TaxID=1137961 RepID=UPI000A39F118|nr:ROK family protein [Allokutzneria sp. NRRL B-24872]